MVGILVLDMRLLGVTSLKEKRHILRSLLDRSRHAYHVGIAEVGDQDLWGNAVVCATCPSSSRDHAESVLTKVLTVFDESPDVEVVSVQREDWWES